MKKEEIQEELEKVDSARFGLVVWDSVLGHDRDYLDFRTIGESVKSVFFKCSSEPQVKRANEMLMAITGWPLETLLTDVKYGDWS